MDAPEPTDMTEQLLRLEQEETGTNKIRDFMLGMKSEDLFCKQLDSVVIDFYDRERESLEWETNNITSHMLDVQSRDIPTDHSSSGSRDKASLKTVSSPGSVRFSGAKVLSPYVLKKLNWLGNCLLAAGVYTGGIDWGQGSGLGTR